MGNSIVIKTIITILLKKCALNYFVNLARTLNFSTTAEHIGVPSAEVSIEKKVRVTVDFPVAELMDTLP